MLNILDRIKGGFWGLLIGDTLGVPYEFKNADKLPPSPEIEMQPPAGFPRTYPNVPPGTWSDDGAQALCLLESLLAQGQMNLADFAKALIAWHDHGLWAVDNIVFDVGNQTAAAIRELRMGTRPDQAGFIFPNGKGNGALMRVLPLALWHTGEDTELVQDAHQQSLVTHGHITNQVCCALYCLWAREMLRGMEVDAAYQMAVSKLRRIYEKNSAYLYELEETIRPFEPPVTDGSGYVVATLHCARLALRKSNYEEVVKKAIRFGGDTDTNAAVAGGLAGIRFGFENIPIRWREGLRGRELAEPLLNQLIDRIRNEYQTDKVL